MKILHVVPTYFPAVRYGGPIWSVHSLCRALVYRGHEVTVLTTNVDGTGTLDVPIGTPVYLDNVQVIYFRTTLFKRAYFSPALLRYAKENIGHYDFLHLHSIFLWPTSSVARIAEDFGLPWCVSPRGSLVIELVRRRNFFIKKLWLNFFEKRNLRNSSFIHATSNQEHEDISQFNFSLPVIKVIPNGVEIPKFKSFENNSKKIIINLDRSLLFLGRVTWKKGLDRLIVALSHTSSINLIVAGNDDNGYTLKLKALAKSIGIENRIKFIGAVYGEEKYELLRNSLLLVLPSYNENFGNVVFESFACGRPAAVTSSVGVSSIILESNTGFILPDNPISMGLMLEEIVKNFSILDAMGAKGFELVSKNFSWNILAEKMEHAYLEAMEK